MSRPEGEEAEDMGSEKNNEEDTVDISRQDGDHDHAELNDRKKKNCGC